MATVTGAFCCDATDAVEVERRRSRDPSRDDPPGWRWETMPTPSPSSSAAAGAPSASPSSTPSYHDEVDPARYDDMLAAKVARLRDRFAPLLRRGALEVEPEVFPSPPEHFRSRCRFAVAPGGGARDPPEDPARDATADPTPTAVPGPPPRSALFYRMFDAGVPTAPIDRFPMALESINLAMPAVLDAVAEDPTGELAAGLEGANFLAARRGGGMLITLLYSRPIGDAWRAAAEAARERLRAALLPALAHADAPGSAPDAEEDVETRRRGDPEWNSRALNVQGRSKGVRLLAGEADHVVERLRLRDGRVLAYRQPEGAFSNPNAFMAESTLDWLCDCSRTTVAAALGSRTGTNSNSGTDGSLPSLLELYCGNGNHTVALAGLYANVAAVELSAPLCDAARDNLARNGAGNARVLHSPSEAVARRMLRRKRRKDAGESLGIAANATGTGTGTGTEAGTGSEASPGIASPGTNHVPASVPVPASPNDFDINAFDVVLVDPPRAGLDPDTLELVSRFDVVLYISCDPEALWRNANDGGRGRGGGLAATHNLARFAVFDHFPYTRHVECGSCWVRRRE